MVSTNRRGSSSALHDGSSRRGAASIRVMSDGVEWLVVNRNGIVLGRYTAEDDAHRAAQAEAEALQWNWANR